MDKKKRIERYQNTVYDICDKKVDLYTAASVIVKHLAPENNLEDPNFIDTPYRILKYLEEIGKGYSKEYIEKQFQSSFPSDYNGIVVVPDIKALSLCPHHFLPVFYRIDFAYMPSGRVLGLSKIIRVIRNLALRPVLQEDFADDVIEVFETHLKPKGIFAVIRGIHTCMYGRGVKNKSTVVTSRITGMFLESATVREEAMFLFKRSKEEVFDE